MYARVHCGSIHNSYDKDRSGCSTHEWIGKIGYGHSSLSFNFERDKHGHFHRMNGTQIIKGSEPERHVVCVLAHLPKLKMLGLNVE